ncbi:T9SS type A sorting domain-containing protein [Polluticoccus soli]|uniref:T9SS type A sorting domain-containing protein n=1 Tax=Polluticoccus soli TaxID=3034150 RepID=UPI0023E2ED67|nr:T9SS type A sorting domain-containing protein [Flavipsychrobacter sp. JY13-12]
MKKLLLITSALFTTLTAVKAQTPVWSTDIAPIINNKCASCHRQGGIAPFSLIGYNNLMAQPGVANAVQTKRMPPWPPDPSYSRLAHERLLSQKEIDKILAWANNGKPQGDPTLAPPDPVFPANGDLPGTPDLISKIPHFTSTATSGDLYQCFVIPSGQAADKYITAIEALPGNRPIVHHVLVYADTTGTCASLDANDPNPGYVSFGGVGTNDAKLLGGWVPGTAPIKLPSGFGIRLPKNADIVIQIHYPAGSNTQIDSTEVHFFFASGPVRRVDINPVLNHVTNIDQPLFIPANATKTFTESFNIPVILGDASILGVAPHMHLIGRNITTFAVTPANDTVKFIRINNWDFHWQGFYATRNIVKVAAGSTLYSHAFYDNTTNNPFNPSNPPQNVSAGENTTDEMMLTYFIYTKYQAGDENIQIDTSTLAELSVGNYYKGEVLFEPYPNPATNELVVKCHWDKSVTATIDLVDISGKISKRLAAAARIESGYSALKYSVADLPAGVYTLRLKTEEGLRTEKLVIQR